MSTIATDVLREIRDSFPAFCRLVMHRDVDPRQIAPFVGKERFSVFLAGRGCGKTATGLMYALWRLFCEPRHVAIWVASAEEVSGHGADVLMDFLTGTPLESYILERSTDRVRFQNRSTLYFLPNSQRRVRGFHGRWQEDYGVTNESNLLRRLAKARKRAPSITVIVDESKDVSGEVYVSLLGVLSTSPSPKAVFMGTAGGRDSWFAREHAAGVEAGGDTRSYILRAEDCDWIDKAYLEEMRRKMTPEEYDAEFCGRFQDAISAYFTAEMISGATKEYEVPLPHDDDYQYIVSIDLAPSEKFGSDFAVVAVLGRHFGGFRPDYTETVVSCTTGRAYERPSRAGEMIEPHIKVFYLARYQTLDHSGLARELSTVKRLFPTLERGVCESYESQQMDALCYRVIRRGPDNEKITRFGRGGVGIAMEVLSPTGPLQHQAFSGLHQLIREGELWLPSGGEHVKTLRSELLHLQKQISPAGNISWEASRGFHDDTTYSLLWACYALRQERYAGPLAIMRDGTFVG